MKGRFIGLIAIFLFALTTVSCTKEGTDLSEFNIAYGVIEGDNPDYKIRLDNGMQLIVIVNRIPHYDVTDGQRVLVDYNVIKDDKVYITAPTTQDIILNYIYDILTKDVLNSSALNTPAKQDSIGHDYINVRDAWVGADFLNIHFEVYRNSPYIKHLVNLVKDETRSTDKDIYLTFRHNAQGDARIYPSFGRVSFRIDEILDEVETGETVNFHLLWDGYSSGNQSETIVYTKK